MTIVLLKWIVVIAATANFGFMAFDGMRGLTLGDYIRPKTGKYKGQLGPWAKVVKSIGIDPESTFMKLIFLFWGLLGLLITVCFSMNFNWAWNAMLIFSICSMWYLVPGTGINVLQIILLIIIYFLK